MYMEKPVSSKICRRRNYVRQYERHRRKLRNIKPSIDTTSPKRFSHLERNLKRVQKDREKYRKIKKENDLLIGKIELIMKRKSSIDNENRNKSTATKIGHRAVNRKKELEKINLENKRLIRRIQERQPFYNHLEWKQEAKVQEYFCRNICNHEYTLGEGKKRRRRKKKGFSNTVAIVRNVDDVRIKERKRKVKRKKKKRKSKSARVNNTKQKESMEPVDLVEPEKQVKEEPTND